MLNYSTLSVLLFYLLTFFLERTEILNYLLICVDLQTHRQVQPASVILHHSARQENNTTDFQKKSWLMSIWPIFPNPAWNHIQVLLYLCRYGSKSLQDMIGPPVTSHRELNWNQHLGYDAEVRKTPLKIPLTTLITKNPALEQTFSVVCCVACLICPDNSNILILLCTQYFWVFFKHPLTNIISSEAETSAG